MLDQTVLADGLKSLSLYLDEAEAAGALASVLDGYFQGMQAGLAGPAVVAGLAGGKDAAQGALVGMSVPGAGAACLQTAVAVYWAAIVPSLAWPSCTAVTPPPAISGLGTILAATFATNTESGTTSDQACELVAEKIHTACGAGGLAVFPEAPGGIGTQLIT